MSSPTLALRIDPSNPNHHLWNNNGTWFIDYTACPTPLTAERVRHSLGTKSVEDARQRRDRILGGLSVSVRHSTPVLTHGAGI